VGLIPHFNLLAEQLNAAFAEGNVSEWALDHLQVVDLVGDFNQDGTVDAADYVVWRKGAGVAPTPINYRRWRTSFGATNPAPIGSALGPSSQEAVPEPGALVLALIAAVVMWGIRTRQR
jgi:hypothetical protein